jgi:hypothetical protein
VILRATVERIYADFLMPSRLGEYRRLLETALAGGYRVVSIEGFWRSIVGGSPEDGRWLVLRHDVDTDPGTAAAMWEIDRDLGVESSYYFRLSTQDQRVMRSIADGGGEASYHYEELADLVKRRGVRDPDRVLDLIPEAQAAFAANLARLRDETGLPMRVVASHGDFANRNVGIPNWRILEDRVFRREVGVDLEVYDDEFVRHVISYHSDTHYPRYWRTESPDPALQRGDGLVYLLVHPRHWRVDRLGNAGDDVRRLYEGIRLRSGSRTTSIDR